MDRPDAAIAVFADHTAAEQAVKNLSSAGFDMKNLSVVGKGYHTEEKVLGFYTTGDRVKFWGSRGAFWGGLWGIFFGGLFLSIPVIGNVVVLGYLATVIIGAVESSILVGGLSAVGAALYSLGIKKDSVIHYEASVKADDFLVVAHGTSEDIQRAKAILDQSPAMRVDIHAGASPDMAPFPADHADTIVTAPHSIVENRP